MEITTPYQENPMNTPTTDHRAGRMMTGLLGSTDKRAKVILTVDLVGASRYHQTFFVKKWTGRDGTDMLSVEVKGSWPRQRVLHVNTITGTTSPARESAGDALLVYAAKAALGFAYTGTVPTAGNGTITVTEESVCGICGMELTDPVSIERGIGPQCYGKQTGTKTITGRNRKTAEVVA